MLNSEEIKNLRVGEFIILPGLISNQNPNAKPSEKLELTKNPTLAQLAQKTFDEMRKYIIENFDGNGAVIDVRCTTIYDAKIVMVRFSFAERVRCQLRKLVQKVNRHNEINLDKKQSELQRVESYLESAEYKLSHSKPGTKVHTDAKNKISRHKSVINSVDEELMYLEEELEEELSVEIEKSTGKASERSAISSIQNEFGIKAVVSDHGDYYLVTYKPDSRRHPKSTGRGGMKTSAITTWLLTLKPYTPTKPPAELVTTCTDSYFRTVLNKSGLFASYRRGLVTIHRAGIRHGSLVVDGKTIGPVRNTDHLSLLLAPHGLSVSQCMGSERV